MALTLPVVIEHKQHPKKKTCWYVNFQVVTLTNEKAEMEAELSPMKSEAASLRFRFTEAEKVTDGI